MQGSVKFVIGVRVSPNQVKYDVAHTMSWSYEILAGRFIERGFLMSSAILTHHAVKRMQQRGVPEQAGVTL